MCPHLDALPSVLIIDHDLALLESSIVLLEEEFQVPTATTGEAGLACFQREALALLLLDLCLPGMDGLEILQCVKVLDARVPVMIITAMHEIQRAAQAFKLGAADSLVKPFDLDATLHLLRCTLARQEPPRGTLMTPEEIAVPRGLDVLVGQSASMRQLATTRSWVADTTATVLITGESGVGKAWVASALHQARPRAEPPRGRPPWCGHARGARAPDLRGLRARRAPLGDACLRGRLGARAYRQPGP